MRNMGGLKKMDGITLPFNFIINIRIPPFQVFSKMKWLL
jgi:hypothetical protein